MSAEFEKQSTGQGNLFKGTLEVVVETGLHPEGIDAESIADVKNPGSQIAGRPIASEKSDRDSGPRTPP